MSKFEKDRLEELKMIASGAVSKSYVGPRLEAKYQQGADLFHELGDGNLRDWVTREYRAWYQAWKDGDAPPPCRCSNPGCTLKNGRLPYEIRRQESPFTNRPHPPTDERIKDYLDDHPGAVALTEALDELREKRKECEECFEYVIREEAKIDPSDVERGAEA